MSSWGKFLCEISVPTGGWVFAWVEGATSEEATIPAGTYSTVLHLLSTLDTLMGAEVVGGAYITTNELGYVSITTDDFTELDLTNSSAALYTLLGFTGSETAVSHVVTSANPHTHGWYPGGITYNSTSRGVGLASGKLWLPVDSAIRTWSGSGKGRIVTTGNLLRRRTARFDLIDQTEAEHPTRGPLILADTHLSKSWRWYIDRAVGTPGSQGIQGNPWTHTDTTFGGYWKVTIAEAPAIQTRPEHPTKYSVEVVFNGEPT